MPYQATQACHAVIEATKLFKQPETSLYLVLCSVKDESRLHKATQKLLSNNISFASFYESDLDNQLTAIATEPICGEIRKVFKNFQLLKGD